MAAAVIYGIYNNAIDAIGDDEMTKGIFASYPSSLHDPSTVTLAFDQVIVKGNLCFLSVEFTQSFNGHFGL
jgi:hypothetical protein